MEEALYILVIAILFLLLNVRKSINSKFRTLQEKIDELSVELNKLRQGPLPPPAKKSIIEDRVVSSLIEAASPKIIKQTENEKIPVKKEVSKPEETVAIPHLISPSQSHQPARPPVEQGAIKPGKPGFFERNPDLEKFIGENLANKIGIGILVLGIAFFVKYAIDQDWINPIGRVFIGILCGGVLLGVAHKMRKTFIAFSSVLVGGGIAVLYLTIAIAFHEYHLFSQTAAFIMTLVITGFTVVLSLGYNRVELAIVSILGGFASPFMVSTGDGNYAILFTYIFVLDVGMLVLAYYKKWNLVNIVSYAFTVLLYGVWLIGAYEAKDMWGAIIFATLFYLVFFAMNIVNNLKQRTPFKPLEISLLLSNTFLYYAAGMFILNNEHGDIYKGLFTAGLGVFNFIFAYTLHNNSGVDKKLVFLLIGLVLTFISLAAPIQLEGNYITLFWAAEAVLLLWLSQKSGIRLMKTASVIVTALMVVSLLMDWRQLYNNQNEKIFLRIIFNKAYITSLFAIASLTGTFFLLRKDLSDNRERIKLYKTVVIVAGVIILYTSQFLELQYQLFEYGFDYATQNMMIGSYNMFFMALLLWSSKKLLLPQDEKDAFGVLGVLAMLSYLFFYHAQIIIVRNDYLYGQIPVTGFAFHYVLLVLLIVAVGMSLERIRNLRDFNKKTHNLYSWFYVFFFVFMASAELDHVVVVSAYSSKTSLVDIITQNHKIGYPILWGITSFILITLGLKKKIKHLRIISLSLFLVTLLKLFLVDITGISEGGKIAAFISLGLLLLVVSFMYQRLKKLLLADAPVANSNENQSTI